MIGCWFMLAIELGAVGSQVRVHPLCLHALARHFKRKRAQQATMIEVLGSNNGLRCYLGLSNGGPEFLAMEE